MLPSREKDGVHSDAGLTLIELVVAAALTVLVGTIIVGLFGITQKTAASVGSSTSSTTAAQLTSQTLDRAVRNASAVNVTTIGTDVLLRASTVGNTASASWRCTALYFSASEKTIRMTTSTSAISAPATPTVQTSWTVLARGVTIVPSTAVFAVVSASTPPTGSQTVSYAFRVQDTTSSPAVALQGSSSHLAVQGGLSCF